jgi:hypothetical protein
LIACVRIHQDFGSHIDVHHALKMFGRGSWRFTFDLLRKGLIPRLEHSEDYIWVQEVLIDIVAQDL